MYPCRHPTTGTDVCRVHKDCANADNGFIMDSRGVVDIGHRQVQPTPKREVYYGMTTINWDAIRPHDGTRAGGFQQLCIELAMGEKSEDTTFFTPGDPDGGVDCYEVFEDGSELGWQAKYFDSLGESQFSQMDESVRTALNRHPNLVRYIFCIPLNLADPRIEGRKYPQDRWDERVAKWKRWAEEKDLGIEFELWGKSRLVYLLTQEKHAARRFYWFNDKVFDQKWFEARLKEAIDTADDRYTPGLHVDLGITEQLEYFGRTKPSFERMKSWAQWIRQRHGSLRWTRSRSGEDIDCPGLDDLLEAVRGILEEFLALEPDPWGEVPLKRTLDKLSDLDALITNARGSVAMLSAKYQRQERGADWRAGRSDNPYSRIQGNLNALEDDLATVRYQLNAAEKFINAKVLLLKGHAGAGKTHLMCDFTRSRVEAGMPALLLMGQQFTETSGPWSQLLPQIGLSEEAIDDFIGSLEESGRVSGSRALLLIDALNEGRGIEIWPSHLNAFLARLAESKWIGLVLSVRTTYEELVIPGKVREDAVSLEHRGFEGHEYEAARKFFEHYGIEFQSTPLLTPEFKNPLYLKTICRGLQMKGETRMPRGSSGITAAFDLFTEAVNKVLAEKLDYDGRVNRVRAALEAVADRFWESGDYWLERQTVVDLLDEILPDRDYSKSLFRGLLDEGILSEDIRRARDGGIQYVVRPSYERFGDMVVADLVVADFLRRRDSPGLLGGLRRLLRIGAGKFRRLSGLSYSQCSTTIGGVPFLKRDNRSISPGLLEALCIQVPEETGCELMRLAPEFLNEPTIERAFEESIVWRRLDAFNDETRKVWNELIGMGQTWFGSDPLETLLTVSAIPGHPFNAEFLNDRLREFSMADRDASWTTRMHHVWGFEGSVDRLVDWARHVSPTTDVDNQVVDLSAVTLSWLFTSSNRFLRDAATKALVSLLDGRLESVRRLVDRFADVDDPYVLERVYAAAYGVSMRSRNAEGVRVLALSVYDHVFSQGDPPVHILLRDYARGVVERAAQLAVDLKIDMERVRPPYRSIWPSIPCEEAVQGLIKKLDPTGGDGKNRDAGWKAIESSVLHWDFARYIIGTNSSNSSRDWLSIGIEEERWRPAREWREDLLSEFSKEEHAALHVYESFRLKLIDVIRSATLPTESTGDLKLEISSDNYQQDEAYRRFLAALSTEHQSAWQLLEEERPGFSLKTIQRYVLSRVLDLGWTADRFSSFDGDLRTRGNYTRSERKAERIGKKYQWIAYHEVLAYISDHFQFCQDWGDHNYDGPWQIGLRDIDPSVVLGMPSGREKKEATGTGDAWWAPTTYDDWNPDLPTRKWIMDNSDFPEISTELVVRDPASPNVSWICCYSFQIFQEPHPGNQDIHGFERREVWFLRMACLVPKGMSDRFMDWVMAGEFRQSNWQLSVPQLNGSEVFLGEHCWSPASEQQAEEQDGEPLEWRFPPESEPCPAQLPVVTHSTSGNGYDCSVGVNAVEVCLPSRAIAEACRLTWNGIGADYVDTNTQLAAFDPSAHEMGPGALLIRADILEKYLSDHDLELCWAIMGEKQTIGSVGQPYGWIEVRGAYAYRDGTPDGRTNAEYRQPSPDMSALTE